MLNSRIHAVIVGVLSLGLGIWGLSAEEPAAALAAGTLGFVAGLLSLLPPPSSPNATDSTTTSPVIQSVNLSDSPDIDAPATGNIRGATQPSAATEESTQLPTASPALLNDAESGLFSEAYLRVALDSRLASARRHLRPVALALLEVSEGTPEAASDASPLMHISNAIRETIREADIACRMNDGIFAIILEDTPENGAVWTVERVRRNLVSKHGHHTLWAGVACYPAHAFDSGELLSQAQAALVSAKEWNQDRIEIAAIE